jgi:GxxExxY protein
MEMNELSGAVIGKCIEVHRAMGPGLLESIYQICLCHELKLAGIPFERHVLVPVNYRGLTLDCELRADIVVDKRLVLELKSIEKILPVHEAQLLTYMRLGGWKLGLLINFNVPVLTDGIKRRVLGVSN